MSRGGVGGSTESDSRFISANFSFGCTVLHILLFVALEATTDFEKRESMRTRKQYSSELFGG